MPDGRLATVGRDRTIRIWTTDGKPKSASAPAQALLTKVAASADSKLAIAGDSEGNVLLWDGAKLATVAVHSVVTEAKK
jgi:hypothetical protein